MTTCLLTTSGHPDTIVVTFGDWATVHFRHYHLWFDVDTCLYRGPLGRDLMVVGFTSTYAISAYLH